MHLELGVDDFFASYLLAVGHRADKARVPAACGKAEFKLAGVETALP